MKDKLFLLTILLLSLAIGLMMPIVEGVVAVAVMYQVEVVQMVKVLGAPVKYSDEKEKEKAQGNIGF